MRFEMYFRVLGILMVLTTIQIKLVAQIRSSVSVRTDYSLGDFSENYKPGIGAGVLLQYLINEEIGVLLSVDYLNVKGRGFSDQYLSYTLPSIKAMPLNIGVDYFLSKHFFLRGKGGVLMFREPEKVNGINIGGGLGYQISSWQVTASIDHWNREGYTNFAGLQLAYTFWKK